MGMLQFQRLTSFAYYLKKFKVCQPFRMFHLLAIKCMKLLQ